jgi:hypothetical protein
VLPAEQLRPKIARRREQWKKLQGRPDPRRLVFVDETWAKTNMAPLRGWAPKGQRLHAKVPYGHWKTMTFIAALRCDRIDAPCVFDQPINGESFTAWVKHQLCPTLEPGDISLPRRKPGSSSTISQATRTPPPAPPSGQEAHASCSSRPTAQT